MVNISIQMSVNASSEQVVEVLLEHEKLSRFFDAKFTQIQNENAGERSGGKGSIRQIQLGFIKFNEQIDFADNHCIRYHIVGKAPVSKHAGVIHLETIETSNSAAIACNINYQITCKGPLFLPDKLLTWLLEKDMRAGLTKLAQHFDKTPT